MKNVYLILFAIIICPGIFAQNYVSELVKSEFLKHKNTEVIKDFLIADKQYRNENTARTVKDGQYFLYNAILSENLMVQRPVLSLELYINNEYIVLDLVDASSVFKESVIVTSNRDTISIKNLNTSYYKGVIRGRQSLVSISISKEEIAGFISDLNGNMVIGKLENDKHHIIYNDKNLMDDFNMNCSVIKNDDTLNNRDINTSGTVMQSSAISRCVKFYYETTDEIYVDRGSNVNNVASYVTNLHNQVATLYYNEGIITNFTYVRIWTGNDPYSGSNPGDLLPQFKANVNTLINADLGQLLHYTGNSGGNNGGIATRVDGLCNSNVDEKLSVTCLRTLTYNQVPTFTRGVSVITHEFGHLLGSEHTHDCVWNGNNTAIDGCGPASGYPSSSQYPFCNTAPVPTGGGTIMSYCDQNGLPGINFYLGFGQQPGDRIRFKVITKPCLETCGSCIEDITIYKNISQSIDYQVFNTITSSTFINSNLSVNLKAEKIILKPGFYVSGTNTGQFRAFYDPCSNVFGRSDNDIYNSSEISSKQVKNDVRLYPNPANNNVTVYSEKYIVSIAITSLQGETLFINNFEKINSHELDISNYFKGIYIVTVITDDGTVQTEKLMKN